jgi:hypothetical protein
MLLFVNSRYMFIPNFSPHMNASSLTHIKAPFLHKATEVEPLAFLMVEKWDVEANRRRLVCLGTCFNIESVFGPTSRRLLKKEQHVTMVLRPLLGVRRDVRCENVVRDDDARRVISG